jgi:protein TonB
MEIKKNESKNMEKHKLLFFQMGLLIALFLVLAAFEWKKDVNSISNLCVDDFPIIDQDLAPITPPDKKDIKPVVNTTQLKITTLDINDNIDVDAEDNQNKKAEVFEKPLEHEETPEVEGDEIIKVAPVMPEFPGGTEGLYEFLGANTRYPQAAKDIDLEGIVYVTFIIEKDGSVSNSQILRGIGGGCDEEALRVVRKMPHWTPGKNNLGRPIRVQMNLPVKFILKS